MRRQIIAVALVEPDIERPHQPAGLDVLGEQDRVRERKPVAHHGVLHRKLLGVEDEAAIHREVGSADQAGEHLPEHVARLVLQLHVQQVAGGNEFHDVGMIDLLQQLRAAQDGRAHHPQEIVDRVGHARLGEDDGDVDVAVGLRPRRRLGDDFDGDAGILGAEIAQDRDGEAVREGGRQSDLEHPLRPALLLDDLAERLIDAIEALGDDGQDMPPGLRQHQLLRPALEQGDAQEILKHDHVTAHRALRDRERVGGGGET